MSSPTRDPSRASRASPTRPPQTLEIFAHPPTPNPDPHPQTVQGTALETRGEVTATCYDTSGTRMATCTTQGAIHVWDRVDGPDGAPGTWRQTAAWAAHRSACRAVAFAGAEFGRCLASSSDDGTICLWRESVRAPGAAAAAAATAAAEDGSSEWERCAQLRDSSKPVTRLAFAPADHGLQLAAAGDDGAVRFYSPADQLALHQWELCNESEALRPGAACSGVAWRVPNAAVTDADRFDGPEGTNATTSPAHARRRVAMARRRERREGAVLRRGGHAVEGERPRVRGARGGERSGVVPRDEGGRAGDDRAGPRRGRGVVPHGRPGSHGRRVFWGGCRSLLGRRSTRLCITRRESWVWTGTQSGTPSRRRRRTVGCGCGRRTRWTGRGRRRRSSWGSESREIAVGTPRTVDEGVVARLFNQ